MGNEHHAMLHNGNYSPLCTLTGFFTAPDWVAESPESPSQ